MPTYEPLTELMQFQRDTEALMSIAGRLSWDQETMMPHGSSDQRATEHAALVRIVHTRNTNPRIADWLDKITPGNETEAANIRLIKKGYEKDCKVPIELNASIARVTSKAHGIWASARQNENVAEYLPILAEIIKLKIEKAAALAQGDEHYDALIDEYEPNVSGDEISTMFQNLRPTLVNLRKEILSKEKPKAISGNFDEKIQLKLANELAIAFGYDLNKGRIDQAIHPFSSGSGDDVRITTRTDPSDPFNCIYSTIHEVGHATYEQNIQKDFIFSPLGRGVSLGVHESQSRIYENQLGRSRPFTSWLFHRMRDLFGNFGIDDPETFYKCVNQVDSGFIRTEADELQYNLHVMLRFDLEKLLISGDLGVNDIENAWNERFESDFGYKVEKPSQGVLQDVHWATGAFGYFPTYTLGNVYAGCLYQKMQESIFNLDDSLSNGDLSGATAWLSENIQVHGSLFEPKATIEKATGTSITVGPLLNYLEKKYADLYGL
ncbi:carboxypeptidase M32 [Candidatus Puniceispirillum sp.]|nr:carboxypeptidase M32 [Candidatus Puniceispirillum sp.]